jgi:hypothetical protein
LNLSRPRLHLAPANTSNFIRQLTGTDQRLNLNRASHSVRRKAVAHDPFIYCAVANIMVPFSAVSKAEEISSEEKHGKLSILPTTSTDEAARKTRHLIFEGLPPTPDTPPNDAVNALTVAKALRQIQIPPIETKALLGDDDAGQCR